MVDVATQSIFSDITLWQVIQFLFGGGFLVLIIIALVKLGKYLKSFEVLEKKVDGVDSKLMALQTNTSCLTNAMVEIQTTLAGKGLNDAVAMPLKNYAFEHGLDLDIILRASGIVLRDEAMKDLKF